MKKFHDICLSYLFERKRSFNFQVLRNLTVSIQGKMWEIFTDKHNRSCKTKSFLIHDVYKL
jgi:hypothetical protein